MGKVWVTGVIILLVVLMACTRPSNNVTTKSDIEQTATNDSAVIVCTAAQKANQYCTKEYLPVCGDNGLTYANGCTACSTKQIDSYTYGACELGVSCSSLGGTWLEEYKECEHISQQSCELLGGLFEECASACRHDQKVNICTMQCVMVCSFS